MTATRVDETLPDGWPIRVLAGLQALSLVEHGSLLVRADMVEVTGVTGATETRGRITQILSGELGQGQTFRVNVRYDEALDPVASLPTPEECAADVNRVIARLTSSDPKIKADVEAKLASGQGPKGPSAAPRIAGQ